MYNAFVVVLLLQKSLFYRALFIVLLLLKRSLLDKTFEYTIVVFKIEDFNIYNYAFMVIHNAKNVVRTTHFWGKNVIRYDQS